MLTPDEAGVHACPNTSCSLSGRGSSARVAIGAYRAEVRSPWNRAGLGPVSGRSVTSSTAPAAASTPATATAIQVGLGMVVEPTSRGAPRAR